MEIIRRTRKKWRKGWGKREGKNVGTKDMIMKGSDFWGVTPNDRVKAKRRFGGTHRPHLQDRIVSSTRNHSEAYSKLSDHMTLRTRRRNSSTNFWSLSIYHAFTKVITLQNCYQFSFITYFSTIS
jgi:hypothetical protein